MLKMISGRKLMFSAVLAATGLTAAVPAAAQYNAPPPPPYAGNHGPDGNFDNRFGNGRGLEMRVQRIQQQIRYLDQRNILSGREARGLNNQAQRLRQDIRRLAYNGVNPRERFEVENRLSQLERRVQINAADRNGTLNGRGAGFDPRGQGYDPRNQGQFADQNGRWQDQNGNWHDRNDR